MTECGMPKYHTCNFQVNAKLCVCYMSDRPDNELTFRDLNTDETQFNVLSIQYYFRVFILRQ
jgi:hypothetical protein